MSSGYIGRFAPSPTGTLHFGSLVAALGSFLDARRQGGTWLVRMEDLDRTREVAGAADGILRTLDAFGLHWDRTVAYQSRRTEAYREAAHTLHRLGIAYPCGCSRADVRRSGRPGPDGPVYAGTCRAGLPPGRAMRSLRVRTPQGPIGISDRIQGPVVQDLEQDTGDFVILRADGLFAYQLAVVVDDAWQGVTQVVRGADLLLSTPRQIHLQRSLGLPTPAYAHLPLALDRAGRKLSKQLASRPVDPADPVPALLAALSHLGQVPPTERPSSPGDCLVWAIAHWDSARVPREASRSVEPSS